MSIVPKRLQPWATELSLIRSACWPLLGQLLPKLDGALFRPLTGVIQERTVPDGFDGLEYRGDFNRLLVTEWAMLNFHSDEFYRRATMGESQYLKLDYQKQNRHQAYYLLLDRGPDQYGAPFLIQLALVFVLLRRACEQRLPFKIGYIQEPDEWIVVTLESLEKEIHGHLSHARLMPEMLKLWQESLSNNQVDAASVWIAASSRNSDLLKFGQCLLIDSDRQQDGQLDAVFQPRRQRLRFPLPDDESNLRLLRSPFARQSTVQSAPKTTTLQDFQVHPVSRRCFFYTETDLVTVYIPKNAKPKGHPIKYQKQRIRDTLVGVWHSKNVTAVVTVDDTTLSCIGFFKQAKIQIPLEQLPQQFSCPQHVNPPPLAYVMRDQHNAMIIITDGNEQGIILNLRKQFQSGHFIFHDAKALGTVAHVQFINQVFYYTDGDRTLSWIAQGETQRSTQHTDPIQGLIQYYSQLNGRYLNVLPLIKNADGDWNDELLTQFSLQSEDKPIGSFQGDLIIKRGAFQFCRLPKIKDAIIPAQLIFESSQAIENVSYQSHNHLIIYRTAHFLRVYSLQLEIEIMAMELATYVV